MKKAAPYSIALLAVALAACSPSEKKAELDSNENKASYRMGYEMARQMHLDGVTPNAEAIAQGARDAIANIDAKVSGEEIEELVDTSVVNYMNVRMEIIADRKKRAHPNWQAGQAFLEENGKKEGVVTLESGLQYKVVTEGTGASPKATDVVEVHYHGTIIDGTVFDSSVDRNEKISFPLNRVIPGWTEGLQQMKEGAKYMFYIPSELAYGANPRPGGPIKPHMVLIFEVELFKVNP